MTEKDMCAGFFTRNVNLATLIVAALLLAACQGDAPTRGHSGPAGGSQTGPRTAPAQALDDLYARYWDRLMRLHPSRAVSLGDERFMHRFRNDLSRAYRRKRYDMAEDALAILKRHDPALLGPRDRTSYRIFRHDIERSLRFYGTGLAHTVQMLPVDQFSGAPSEFAVQMAGSSIYPYESVAHYEKALSRAEGFAQWIDRAIVRMREGMIKGVVQPRVLMEKTLPQLEAHLDKPAEQTIFYQPVRNFPDSFDAEERERLTAAFRKTITDVIQPAYRRLFEFIRDKYLPRTRDTAGLWEIPGGRELYGYLVEMYTTTDLTPRQIHDIGLEEVDRIMAEIDKVRRQIGYEGTVPDFLAHVREGKDLFYKSGAEKLARFEAIRKKINARLPRLFNLKPPVDYEIKPVPAFLEKSRAAAYYESPAPDGTRPGIFWVNTYNASDEAAITLTTLSLHEASPGHHFQISIAQQQTALPAFRRFDGETAYVEGWALYAETLGQELGLYEDPWQYLGHLSYEIHRANRLVVDTGLHALRWNREKAIDWLTEHSAMPRHEAVAEVERYMALPGQALAYKIGERRIRALRERARAVLGPAFDIRQFHDFLLRGASMPLSILEDSVTRWIEEQKTAAKPTAESAHFGDSGWHLGQW